MAFTSNIFQKEDNFHCSKHLATLSHVKWFMRIIFLAVIPLNIFIYIFGADKTLTQFRKTVSTVLASQIQFQDYNQAQDSIITLMMIQDNSYNGIQPDEINQLLVTKAENLNNSTQNIRSKNYDNYWMEVLYNDIPSDNNNISSSSSVEFNDELDNVTFFYDAIFQQMLNSVNRINDLDSSSITSNNLDVNFFNQNAKKQVTSKIRVVIDAEIRNLKNVVQRSGTLAIIMLIIEVLLFLISLAAIFKLILKVINCFKIMLEVFTYIDDEKIKETESYYRRVLNHYKITVGEVVEIADDDDDGSTISKKSRPTTSNANQASQQNRPKKAKGVLAHGFLKQTRFKVIIFYIISVIMSSAMSVCLQYITSHMLNQLEILLTDGQKYFQSVSYIPDVMMALKQKQFNKTTYELYIYPNIKDEISELKSADLSVPLNDNGYEFESIYNEIVSRDACSYFKDALNNEPTTNYAYCQQVVLGKLASGMFFFKSYFQANALSKLNFQDNSTMDISMLFELDMGVETLKVVVNQLLQAWQTETFQKLDWTDQVLMAIISMVSILNFVIFVLAEYLVAGTLQEKFLFYREVYNRNMLTEALTQDKKIKYTLVNIKVIQK